MDFDDWMLTKDPKYHPTDDTVALRRLRECWNDAQKYAVPPAPTFADGMTAEDDMRFLELTNELTHNAEVSGAGTASAGLPGYTAGDNTE